MKIKDPYDRKSLDQYNLSFPDESKEYGYDLHFARIVKEFDDTVTDPILIRIATDQIPAHKLTNLYPFSTLMELGEDNINAAILISSKRRYLQGCIDLADKIKEILMPEDNTTKQ